MEVVVTVTAGGLATGFCAATAPHPTLGFAAVVGGLVVVVLGSTVALVHILRPRSTMHDLVRLVDAAHTPDGPR